MSLLLHGAAVLWLNELKGGEEVRRYRSRLAHEPRFEPSRLPTFAHTAPDVELDYLSPETAPQLRPQVSLPLPPPTPAVSAPEQPLAGALETAAASKPASAELRRLSLPDPTDGLFADRSTAESLEFLRFEDMARADRFRGAVTVDPHSRRGVTGYINFTMLRLDGAGNYPREGSVVDELLRYIRPTSAVYFLSPELQKDPIHFLFPTPRLGGRDPERLTYFSNDELRLLSKYLRSGGFLFIDAGGTADDRRFLIEIVAVLRQLVLPNGRLFEIPASHLIYHSFYEYQNGFPGELKQPVPIAARHSWLYPERPPDALEIRGLWGGVEVDGDLVAVISDLNLHLGWSGRSPSAGLGEGDGEVAVEGGTDSDGAEAADGAGQEPVPAPKTPFLRAATNVVVYALTRPRGLTLKRALPVANNQARSRARR